MYFLALKKFKEVRAHDVVLPAVGDVLMCVWQRNTFDED